MTSPADPVLGVAGAVPGVAAVAAEQTDDGAQVLRVQLDPDADAAEVALAVGRLVAGAPVTSDPPPRDPVLPQARSGSRPQIVRTDVRSDGAAFSATVELTCAGRSASGTAGSALTTSGTRRALATATLHAVQGLLPQPVHLELEHVERSEAGGEPVVVDLDALVGPGGGQRLAGSAVVRDDESGAVVRAALDAVDRRVEALLD